MLLNTNHLTSGTIRFDRCCYYLPVLLTAGLILTEKKEGIMERMMVSGEHPLIHPPLMYRNYNSNSNDNRMFCNYKSDMVIMRPRAIRIRGSRRLCSVIVLTHERIDGSPLVWVTRIFRVHSENAYVSNHVFLVP